MRSRNARKMWRIWQPCLYVYCVTLQNRIEDKHMNVLTFKLLMQVCYWITLRNFIFFSFKVYFFVIVLLDLVSLQVIVLKRYITELQTSVFQNDCSIILSFGLNRTRPNWILSDCHCFMSLAQHQTVVWTFGKIHHKNTSRKLVNTSQMEFISLS